MSEQIIKCSKCGENLVFINGDRAELNYNFVFNQSTREYVWPKNHIPFARVPANRSKMKVLRDARKEAIIRAEAEGREGLTRREQATILPILVGLQNTHHGDFKRLQIDLNFPSTLKCLCGEKKVVGKEEEI